MNKSKILKRSLAVILAMMMIFAMIPLSASAAEGPVLTGFTVNAVNATISGTDITAETTTTSVTLGARYAEGQNISVYLADKDTGAADTEKPLPQTIADLATISNRSGNVFTAKIAVQASVDKDDAPVTTVYTLKITLKQDEASKETGISTVVSNNHNLDDMVSYDIDIPGRKIAINLPYGHAAFTPVAANFKATNAKATVQEPEEVTANKAYKVVVLAEDKATTAIYSVSISYGAGFTSFAVDDQTKDATIKDSFGKDEGSHTVEIAMPFGSLAEGEDKVIPTFEVDEGIIAVTTAPAAYNKNVVKSGETEVTFAEHGGVYGAVLYLWTSKDFRDAVPVLVVLTPAAKNPEAELEEIYVVSNGKPSNTVEVDGSTISVEMPASWNPAVTPADGTATVEVKASANATVKIQDQGTAGAQITDKADVEGAATLENVNVASKQFVIRVVSEDGETYNDYTINLTAADKAESVLRDFTVKGKLNGEDFSASAEITAPAAAGGKGKVVLTLPYAFSNEAKLNELTVYVTATTGAAVGLAAFDDETGDPVRPTKLVNDGAAWAAAFGDVKLIPSLKGVEWQVYASDSAYNTYDVSLAFEAPKTGRKLISAELSSKGVLAEVNADNTFAAEVGKDASTPANDTLKVTVPASQEKKTTPVYFTSLELSEGAVAFVKVDEKYVPVQIVEEGKDAVAAKITAKKIAEEESAWVAPDSTTGKLTIGDIADDGILYVVSESVAIPAMDKTDGSIDEEDFEELSKSAYYIYAVAAAPESGKNITSMESTLDTKVKASVSGNTVTIKVPGSYNDTKSENATAAMAASKNKTQFSLNFEVSKLATLFANLSPKKLVSDYGNEDLAKDASKFFVFKNKLYLVATETPVEVDNLVVLAENTETNGYNVVVVVGDLEKGADLTSVEAAFGSAKVTGTISGKDVTVVAPFGAKLNPVKLTLKASEMAAITVAGAPYDANKNYDLSNPVTVKVTSEDGLTSKVYTIKASTAAQFDDVKEGSWYYDSVMKAAAAGIIVGYNGKFRPNDNVTRQDFAVMVVNMLGADVSSYTTPAFKDCEANYAMEEIAYLKDKGIIVGDPEGTFRPTATITRSEVAVIIAKALNLSATTEEKFADDASIQNWAKEAAYKCKAAKIMVGNQDGNFKPKSNLTRAEAAQIMVMSQAKK